MTTERRALAICLLFGLSPALAGAQDAGQAGITMGHPGAVGVLWHVSERVAIRPDLQFTTTSSEASSPETGATSSSSGWTVIPGVSAVLYLQGPNRLRTYVSPRFTFSHSTIAFESPPGGPVARSTNKSYSGAASFGAQYSLTERFSVFAEAGVGVTRTTGSSDSSSFTTSGHQWATRTGVGAVLYF